MSNESNKSSTNPDGIDFAWRVHEALDSWTGKVDVKASIALGIEIAVFGFVVTLTETPGRLSGLKGAHLTLLQVGIALIVLSIVLSLAVVFPQIARCKSRRDWKSNMIFFGHLRRWEPAMLADELRKGPVEEEQLAKQLVAMSKIAWRKHAWLQFSIISFIIGSACLLLVSLV